MQRLECFFIFMYSKGCSAADVIAATIGQHLDIRDWMQTAVM